MPTTWEIVKSLCTREVGATSDELCKATGLKGNHWKYDIGQWQRVYPVPAYTLRVEMKDGIATYF
jgi:hypothetical protein